jgi:prepilin-type N-terminal cleavage/methylation domain-containing protein
MKPRGFTLVEMIAAISILSIGIVAVLRSFLGVSAVLDSVQNQIDAVCFLESKTNDFIESQIGKPFDPSNKNEEGTVELGNRVAAWNLEASEINEEGLEDMSEVSLNIAWKEGSKEKDFKIITYFLNKDSPLGE